MQGDDAAAVPEPAAPAAGDAARSNRIARPDFLLIGAIVGVIRAAYSWGRISFLLNPDEFAIGGMARYLGGDGPWNMFAASTWRPGMSTLLVPLVWLTDDPELFVRGALLVSAAIGGWSAMWLAAIGERVTNLRGASLGVATIVVMSFPASLSATAYVWAESLVTLSFLACAWYTIRYYEDGAGWSAAAAVIWAAVGYTAHGRLLPFLVLVASIVVLEAGRRRAWSVVCIALVGSAAGVVLSNLYASHLFGALWEVEGSENTVGAVLRRLGDPLEVLDAAGGQVWYLLVTTAGLFGFGFAALLERVTDLRPELRRSAMVLLGLTVPMLGVSVVFLSGRVRADYFVYGRYNDAIVAPVLLIGASWLLERTSDRRQWILIVGSVVGLIVALGLMVEQLHGHQLARRAVLPMVAGLQPVATSSHGIPVLLTTTLAIVLIVVLASVTRWTSWPNRWIGVGVLLLVVAVGLESRSTLPPTTNPNATAAEIRTVESIRGESIIHVSLISERFEPEVPFVQQRARALAYQWYLPGREFRLLTADVRASGTVVIGTPSDAYLLSIDAEQIWVDPVFPMALWRLP